MPENKKKKKTRNTFECHECGYKWFGRRDPSTILNGAQCVDAKCASYHIFCHELLEEQIKQIKTLYPTKEDLAKFLATVNFLLKHHFIIHNKKDKARKFGYEFFIKKLKESY